jgi:hypothetical protein
VYINGLERAIRLDLLEKLPNEVMIQGIDDDSCRLIAPFCECVLNKGIRYVVKVIEDCKYDVFLSLIVDAGIELNDVLKYLINDRKAEG